MRRKKEERGGERGGEQNAINSGHLCLCQQPRAAHALRSDQHIWSGLWEFPKGLVYNFRTFETMKLEKEYANVRIIRQPC
jgi:hypothetical protein